MRFLINSICLLLLVGCKSYPKRNGLEPTELRKVKIENPYFSDATQDYVYKATIHAFDQRFGGLLIIKKLGLEHHRIVFTTEMGNTIFDFTLQGSDFRVNRILKEMDRKIVLSLFRKDFEVLIKAQAPVKKAFTDGSHVVFEADNRHKKYYYFYIDHQLKKIVRTGNGNEKVSFQFSGIKGNIATQIHIDHSNIELQIALKAL